MVDPSVPGPTVCQREPHVSPSHKTDGRIHVYHIALRLGLRTVFGVHVGDRALAQEAGRQHHDTNEAGRAVSGLGEDGRGSGLEPGTARCVAARSTLRIDADTALDQTADAGPLMGVKIRASTRRKGNAVAAHEQTLGERPRKLATQLDAGGHRCARSKDHGASHRRQLPSPERSTGRSCGEACEAKTVPRLIVTEISTGDGDERRGRRRPPD